MMSRISYRLMAWFLVAALVPTLGVGFLAYRFTIERLEDSVAASLSTVASDRAESIEDYFRERQRDVSVLALDPTIADALADLGSAAAEHGLGSPRYDGSDQRYRAFLGHIVETFGYHDLFLISPDGTVVFTVKREADFGTNLVYGAYHDTPLAGVFERSCTLLSTEVSEYQHYAPSNEPSAFLAAPVLASGTLMGVLAVQVSTKEIQALAANYSGLGETGETILVASATGAATFLTPTRHDPQAAFARTVDGDPSHPVHQALKGMRDQGLYEDYRGREVLAAWRYIPQTRWAMVVKIDADEAFAPVAVFRRWGLIVGLVTVLAVIGLALVSARSFSRPISSLASTAATLAGGDLTVRAAATSKDELGDLARTFNRMVDVLQRSMEDARLKVEYLDQVPSPVVAVNLDREVLFANRAAADIVGRSREECLGQRCSTLFGTTHCDTAECRMTRCWQEGSSRTGEAEANLGGEAVPIRYTCGPLRDDQGTIVGGIEFLFDISAEAEIVALAGKVAGGDLDVEVPFRDADDRLAAAVQHMTASLHEARDERERQIRHTSALSDLKDTLQQQKDIAGVAARAVRFLCEKSGARVGLLYVKHGDQLSLAGTHAYTPQGADPTRFALGQGLVGEVAQKGREVWLQGVAGDSLRASSGLVDAPAAHVLLLPLHFEQEVQGIVELGFLDEPSDEELALLRAAGESIGVAVIAAITRADLRQMLHQTEEQAHALEAANEELQAQQEELRSANEELQVQEEELRQTNEELEEKAEELGVQGEQLRQANEELEEKARLLEEQKRSIRRQNAKIEAARQELEVRAEQLALTSRYKSEFLANMSHELRTPLNSMLILSSLLADNADGNLTRKQVEYAETVHSSGSDLLVLINEILDLAKIESGTMAVEVEDVRLDELAADLERSFSQVARQGEIEFSIDSADGLPPHIRTDGRRLKQVLKNLLGNAFKFTERGRVTLGIAPAGESALVFAVTDTGIGIPHDEQRVIFEAFQQADGSSSRRYGGTGLGLSISREIAGLLAGELSLASEPGEGSTFTLRLPLEFEEPAVVEAQLPSRVDAETDEASDEASVGPSWFGMAAEDLAPFIEDDREIIQAGDHTVLLVEDDRGFACGLRDVARERGFRCLVAGDGESGLCLARHHRPDAIVLDIALPGIDGWTVLEHLKDDPDTRPIPVHVVSAALDEQRAIYGGAIAALQKPAARGQLDRALSDLEAFIERPHRRLLLVEDDPVERDAIEQLLQGQDVDITSVATGKEALEALESRRFECMILDLGLPGMTGFEVLQEIERRGFADVPVVVYTGRELTRKEAAQLGRRTRAIVVKDVRSPDRLLQETALFLHRVHEGRPSRRSQPSGRRTEAVGVETDLDGKRLLVVDDDLRNIFALTSLLESHGAEVAFAENGRDGLKMLEQDGRFDGVLMDIMMPEMDGYEATRAIRENPRFENLPVIALTAKAMRDDRQRCLDAGASDYISKPVDVAQLLSLLRVWLYER